MRTDKKTGIKKRVFEYDGKVPPEHKNPGKLYENYQITKLRKWAPVRTYFGSLGEKGEPGERWKLFVKLLTRHSGKNLLPSKPQSFSLIVTIADPEKKAPVYDEMVRLIQNRFEIENLAVRAAARIRTKTQPRLF
jgi:hypothetical protein